MNRAVPHTRPYCLALGLMLLAGRAVLCAEPNPAVVELFTSEGCSSCPPAEALLGRLAAPSVIALAWHVNYWDALGWHDRFELPLSAIRQNQYAHALKLSALYTPQMVINGERDVLGSDEHAVHQSLSALPLGGVISIGASGDQVLVTLAQARTDSPCDVQLISSLRTASSHIGAGENAGRELHEFNIVRSLITLGQWNGQAAQYRVALAAVPADATDVAVLLQIRGSGAIQSAATRALR